MGGDSTGGGKGLRQLERLPFASSTTTRAFPPSRAWTRVNGHGKRPLGEGRLLGLDIWFVLAIGLSFSGYAVYLLGLRRHIVEPNRASWLIWAAATGIEA